MNNAHNQNSKYFNFLRNLKTQKSMKAILILSLISCVLMISIMIPVGPLNALAVDNNSVSNNSSDIIDVYDSTDNYNSYTYTKYNNSSSVNSLENSANTTIFVPDQEYNFTIDLAGGTIDEKYLPTGWNIADGTSNKTFPEGTTYGDIADEWNDSFAAIKKPKRKIDKNQPLGENFNRDDVLSSNVTFSINWKDESNLEIAFFKAEDSAKYLDMFVDGEVVEDDKAYLYVKTDANWYIQTSTETPVCSVFIQESDSTSTHSVSVKVKDNYKDVFVPQFYLDGSSAKEGTISSDSSFIGIAMADNYSCVEFMFDEASQDKGSIYDADKGQIHDASFCYYFPVGVTISYEVDAKDEKHITFKPSSPFDDEIYEFELDPDENEGVNCGYWGLDNIARLIPGSTGTFTADDNHTLVANFYTEPVVVGTVKDASSDEPLEWANLKMIDSESGDTICVAVTEEDGSYYMFGPAEGTYKIYCSYNYMGETYYDYVSDEIYLSHSGYYLDIKLTSANIEDTVELGGTIVSPSTGESICVSNAAVTFTCKDSNFVTTAITDDNGQFFTRIPKNQQGNYFVDTQGRYNPHSFYFPGASTDEEAFIGTIFVYKVDDSVCITIAVDNDDVDYGLIELISEGYNIQCNYFYDFFDVAKSVGAYPTFEYNNDNTITITTIYMEQYTFSPKRFGSCEFICWNEENLMKANITEDKTFSANFGVKVPENDLSLNGNGDGFSSYGYSYKNSDGIENYEELTQEEQYFTNNVYAGSVVVLSQANQICIAYNDAGEVKEHEFTEVSVIDVNCVDGYEVDSIILNGQKLNINEPITVTDAIDFTVSYKANFSPVPIPSPIDNYTNDTVDSAAIYASSNSAYTSDYTLYAFIALSVFFSCSVAVLYLRRHISF